MNFSISNQNVFESSRHTALFLLSELYSTIESRLEPEISVEISNILSDLLNSESRPYNIESKNNEDHSAIRFIKFYLEFNHIAERFHRIYLAKEKHVVPKLMSDFDKLRPGISNEKFESFLNHIEIDLVFTAHPTEIFERKILKKYIQIHKNLKTVKDSKKFGIHNRLTKERRALLLSLWLAPDFGLTKPKAKDEAKLAQLIFQYSLWDGVTKFKKRFHNNLRKYNLPLTTNKNLLKFSSWMGGDRDGNPNVTTKSTVEIIKSFSKKSVNLYFREFKRLKEDLCFDVYIGDECISIERKIEVIQKQLSKIIRDDYKIADIKEAEIDILKSLKKLYDLLVGFNAKSLADQRLRSLIDRLETLGILGMRWDFRQESAYHDLIIDNIFQDLFDNLKYSEMPENKKQAWLENHVSDIEKRLLDNGQNFSNDESQDFVDSLFLIKKLGSKIIPYYIISMTRASSDLLLMQILFKIFEIQTKVVPLFETLEDLENSTAIIEPFLKYDRLNSTSGNFLPIMLGYSDSAKTGSRLASVWNLYLAQKKLVKVATESGYECQFFHGRGGSIGRGGGPVQHAISSCPIESMSKGFRMTIQGEVIFDRFGFSSIAVQSMMTYVMSLINYQFSERKQNTELKGFESIFSEMSEISKIKYRKLIESEKFLDYFEKVTPVNYISELNIGSRPAKRQSSKKSYRAIPWVFGWTQNRCLLPAWYGAGTALEHTLNSHGVDKLKSLYESFFLFRSTLDLIYMTYLKIEMDVFKRYDEKLAGSYSFKSDIVTEYDLLKKCLLQIVDPNKINHQNLEEKLYGRLEVLDSLHNLQIDMLAKAQANNENFSKADKKSLLLTIQALASGMGNTG